MKLLNQPEELSDARTAFIETLSDEFIATTGYGVYAYLNPLDINRLFRQYLQHGTPLREFARVYVRNAQFATM